MLSLEDELRLLKKGAMTLHLPPYMRLLIERYRKEGEFHSESAAVREIISAGLITAGMTVD